MSLVSSLLEAIIGVFSNGQTPVDPVETVEIVRFIEAANQSRETGRPVAL